MTDSTSGDGDSFESTLAPHLPQLYRLAHRLTGTRSDAEDLIQDTLIKLFARNAELSSIRDLKPWLGRVLFNQFIDERRRYARRPLHLVDDAIDPDTTAAAAAELEPDQAALRDDGVAALEVALAQISEDHRMVLMLHDVEGYKLTEIQELTGTPVGTLKSRLHRGRARLREILAGGGTVSEQSACYPMDGVKIDAV